MNITPGKWEARCMGSEGYVIFAKLPKPAKEMSREEFSRCSRPIVILDGEREEQKANAERIVKAVNCHDDLYEALRGITAQFSLVEPLYAKDREYIAQADKALAKVDNPSAL